MGPLIQLDNLTLAAFPPMSKEEAKGNVSSWHRDRWSHFPTGFYETSSGNERDLLSARFDR